MEEMTAEQIRFQGLEALRRELGAVGMIRFMQQFSNGHGNYTEERHEWLDKLTVEEIMAQINARQQEKPE